MKNQIRQMPPLSKEELLELQEQFKSVKNIFAKRFSAPSPHVTTEAKPDEDGQVEMATHRSAIEKSSKAGEESKKESRIIKKSSYKKLSIPNQAKEEQEEQSERTRQLMEIKKFNYTKNSLNCIPLSNRMRQIFIRFVEWKGLSNIILTLVFINSIILGIVDYRYQGSPTAPNAPIGNKILSITEPIYAVVFTAEAAIKIIAQGFILSKKTYLRDPWNILDFVVVVTSLFSFLPNVKGVSILRAFRLFKPLRNLQQFPSMRLLMRTLMRSADRLQYLIIFYFFVMMIFAIIGVNLMQGITNQRCRATSYPVKGDWLLDPDYPFTCQSDTQCKVACGSLYDLPQSYPNGTQETFKLNASIDLSRDGKTKDLMFGFATFDNFYLSMLTLFEIAMLQDWYKISYMMMDATSPIISSAFFVVYLLMTNYFLQILTVGILMQKFIEFNEHKERQEIFSKIMGQGPNGEPINIEELKNRYHADRQNLKRVEKLKKMRERKAGIIIQIKRTFHKLSSLEVKPLPESNYHKYKLPQLCWRIHQNYIYESALTLLAVVNAMALAFSQYAEESASNKDVLQQNINYLSAIVATIFLFDQLIKFIGQGAYLWISDYENALYSLTSIGSIIHISISNGTASPITAFMLLKLFKIIRRSNLYRVYDQLSDSMVFTLSVMLSYCSIIVLFVYIFALLGMQFFAGRLMFNSDGNLDLVNGTVPRMNFDTISWSIVTVLTCLIGDDWSYIMFNCIMATGWFASFYFILMIVFGQMILMNLFFAILIGNFEEASLIMRDSKFLKSIQNARSQSIRFSGEFGNKVSTEAALMEEPVLQEPQIKVDALSQTSRVIKQEKVLSEREVVSSNPENVVTIGIKKGGTLRQIGDIEANKKPGNQSSRPAQKPAASMNNFFSSQGSEEEISPSSKSLQNINYNSQTQRDTPNQSLFKQAKIDLKMTKDKNFEIKHMHKFQRIVRAKRLRPFSHHYEQSSLGIFSRKSTFRQFIYNVIVDPEFIFPDPNFDLVQLEELDPYSQQEMLSLGYRKGYYVIQRRAYFFTVEWEAIEAYISVIRRQEKEKQVHKYIRYKKMHTLFRFIFSGVIAINLILLLLFNPVNDPSEASTLLIKWLDITCTGIFILEVLLKIIALGFFNTSITGSKPFTTQVMNVIDLLLIILAIIDLSSEVVSVRLDDQCVQLRYRGLMNSFKCIRSFHILQHFKKNDLLQIIFNTLKRSLKPILVTLIFTATFLLIYGIIGTSFMRGKFFHCSQAADLAKIVSLSLIKNKYGCNDYGGDWVNPPRNFDNIFNAMLTLFEMMSREDWLQVLYMGIDQTSIGQQPDINNNPSMILYFVPFMIMGHIFIWRMYGGVMIENFNRARDKFYDYALMTSEQRNWVEMQRSLIEKRLKVKVNDYSTPVKESAQAIIQSSKFDFFILGCIMANTILQAVSYFGNPEFLDQIQETAGYAFAVVFNVECILKLIAMGKYYFWVSHNIFDFALIIGTDVGIFMSLVFPNLSIGPLATLLRAFRIGRVLNLLKEKKSLKMLIDTIFYILPILIKIIGFMFMIILIYAIIGMQIFSKVMYQTEVNENANFDSATSALLLLFRCTTGQKWNLLMHEYTLSTSFEDHKCLQYQSYEHYQAHGPMQCGSLISYPFFLSYVIIMQLMIVNLFIAIVLEGFAQFSIQNNAIVGSHDYELLIDLWSDYDPTATGWIKPKHLAFLIYELPAPLGRQEDYKDILKKTLDHRTIIKQYSDKKAINMKTKFIYNQKKGLILPHNTVLKLLLELCLPVYNLERGSMCHFKDVCLTVTKMAINQHIDNKVDISIQQRQIETQFDRIPEEQQKRLDEGWQLMYQDLGIAKRVEDFDTGKFWAGLYILKMIRLSNNGFGRSQFKKQMAQNRLFTKLKKRHNMYRNNDDSIEEQMRGIFTEYKKALDKGDEKVRTPEESPRNDDNINILDQEEGKMIGAGSSRQRQVGTGGPQRRGRSPMSKNKDHMKSTWWKPQLKEIPEKPSSGMNLTVDKRSRYSIKNGLPEEE